MKTLVCAVLLLALGCAGQYEQAYEPPPELPTDFPVEILSEPPGARIEVNGGYVGQTPCTAQIRRGVTGLFAYATEIKAIPIHPGGYVQVKRFDRYDMSSAVPVPQRIFFDMRLSPHAPLIDVTIR